MRYPYITVPLNVSSSSSPYAPDCMMGGRDHLYIHKAPLVQQLSSHHHSLLFYSLHSFHTARELSSGIQTYSPTFSPHYPFSHTFLHTYPFKFIILPFLIIPHIRLCILLFCTLYRFFFFLYSRIVFQILFAFSLDTLLSAPFAHNTYPVFRVFLLKTTILGT